MQNRKGDDMTSIEEINTIAGLKDVRKALDRRGLEIQDSIWELVYKHRCPENYVPWSELLKDIIFWNHEPGSPTSDDFREHCIYNIPSPTINDLFNAMDSFDYTQLGQKFPKMICEACACQNCPCLKEHLGYDCSECRNKKHFRGYEGYCDE